MKTYDLIAYTRKAGGKGSARQCRREGRIPAILYGMDIKPRPLAVIARDFANAARRADTIHMMVNLQLDGNGQTAMALVREVQKDPLSNKIVHIDFLHVSPERELTLTVPVHLKGIPDGVKTHGGIVQHILRDLEIEALPANIPEFIEVEVEALGIGDSVHVRDIAHENVTILSDPRKTVVTVVPPTVIKETVTTAAAEAEAAGAPEVVGEEEGEEGEGEKEKEKEKDKKEKKESKEK
jgi:large subunit ribosomal protein L25